MGELVWRWFRMLFRLKVYFIFFFFNSHHLYLRNRRNPLKLYIYVFVHSQATAVSASSSHCSYVLMGSHLCSWTTQWATGSFGNLHFGTNSLLPLLETRLRSSSCCNASNDQLFQPCTWSLVAPIFLFFSTSWYRHEQEIYFEKFSHSMLSVFFYIRLSGWCVSSSRVNKPFPESHIDRL